MKNNKSGQGCGEIGIFQSLWVELFNGTATLQKSLTVPQNTRHKVSVQASNPSARYIPKRNENVSCGNWYVSVHSSVIHKSQKMKIAQMSIS